MPETPPRPRDASLNFPQSYWIHRLQVKFCPQGTCLTGSFGVIKSSRAYSFRGWVVNQINIIQPLVARSRFNSDPTFATPERGGAWITEEFIEAYTRLHREGHAHSVECRLQGELVGGIYGVAIGGLFAGELTNQILTWLIQTIEGGIRVNQRIAAWPPRGFTPCPTVVKNSACFASLR
jgi:hypothetical protein